MLSRELRLALVLVTAATLSACATHTKPTPQAPPPPPPPPPAQAYTAPPPAPVRSGPLPGSVQDFTINVGDRVYFDYDKYTIRPDGVPVLKAQAEWLQRYPAVKVRIEGNTDERGTEEYNLALGGRRAEAVKSYLIAAGVDPSRIATISYGKERPIASGSDEEAWAKNRNAHTAITSGAQ